MFLVQKENRRVVFTVFAARDDLGAARIMLARALTVVLPRMLMVPVVRVSVVNPVEVGGFATVAVQQERSRLPGGDEHRWQDQRKHRASQDLRLKERAGCPAHPYHALCVSTNTCSPIIADTSLPFNKYHRVCGRQVRTEHTVPVYRRLE